MKKYIVIFFVVLALGLVACGENKEVNNTEQDVIQDEKVALIPFAPDVDWNTTLNDIKSFYGTPDEEGTIGELPAIQYNDMEYNGNTGMLIFCFSSGRLANASFKVISDEVEETASIMVGDAEFCNATYGEAYHDALLLKKWKTDEAVIEVRGLGVNAIFEYYDPELYEE